MALILIDICLSDIPANKMTQATNGKFYTKLMVADLKEVDERGNTHNVYVNPSKEEREAKAKTIYIGRGRDIAAGNNQAPRPPQQQAAGAPPLPWMAAAPPQYQPAPPQYQPAPPPPAWNGAPPADGELPF